MKICPKCKSKDVKLVEYMGVECIVCNNCDFDGRNIYDQYPESKKSQKAKSGFSPYKTGGKDRTIKR